MLSGFDTKYIKFSSPPTAFDLKGKDRYGPGEQSYLAFVSDKTTLSAASFGAGSAISRLDQPVTVNFCDKETTLVQIPICVNLNPFREGKCPTEVTE